MIPPRPIRLHYNENTAGCSPAVLEALRSMDRTDISMYPESASRLAGEVAAWFGVAEQSVVVTNGLDEGIQAVAQCGVWHGTPTGSARAETLIVDPTFEVYEFCAAAVASRLVRVGPDPDFTFPLERVLRTITPSTRVVFLTDPNNPTGQGIPPGAVETIAAAAGDALVLVDEAYGDFSGRTVIGPILQRHRNVLVGRTFAKAHGLAGLRVGALIAHPDTLSRVRRLLLPFSVNVCALTALSAALRDRTYLDWSVNQAAASRHAVYEFCTRRNLTFWRSEANFVLFRLGDDASRIAAALAGRGILVRDKSDAPGCAGCIRLTTGVLDHTRLALAALEEILATRTH